MNKKHSSVAISKRGSLRGVSQEVVKPNSDPAVVSAVPATQYSFNEHGDVVAEFTGLSDRRLRELAKEGHFPPPIDGMYRFKEAVQGVCKYYRLREDSSASPLAVVKLEHAKDKGRQEKVSADLAEGKVIEKALVRQMITRCILNIKFKALGVAKKLAQRLAIETDPINIEQILNAEMRDVISDAQFDYGFIECPNCKEKVI